MKVRKKPVTVEAFQLGHGQMPAWFMRAVDNEDIYLWPDGEECVMIHTLEGWLRGNKEDWIIQGVKGEIYACKPDIFEQTYERIEEE